MSQELIKNTSEIEVKSPDNSVFSNIAAFENAQRMAQVLVKSDLVPKSYRGNIPNAMIALELAVRVGVSPFMVMQNMDVIQGKPSWNSAFIIAVINSCGRFEPLKFKTTGKEGTDDFGYIAYTKDKDGNELVGPAVTWRMVKAEGWLSKPGSKWKTMPDLMFRYRSASFFGRLYAPDILKGMHTVDEVQDINNNKQNSVLTDIIE